MKNRIFIIAGVAISGVIIVIFGLRLYTKSFSPEADAFYDKDGIYVGVSYCQPSKNGRVIFGDVLPYGKIWRTGANEATTIHLNRDSEINDSILSAGKYSLFTIPNENSWTIIFNDQTGQWGTIYNASRDVLRVNVPVKRISEEIEKFTIEFEEEGEHINMYLKWDHLETIVSFHFIN